MNIGDTINKWTVIGEIERKNYISKVLCRCSCGLEKMVNVDSIKRGLSKSCGCLRREVCSRKAKGKVKDVCDRSIIFGFGVNDFHTSVMSSDTPLVRSIYMKWYLMISRCYSSRRGNSWGNTDRYSGCSVCIEWSRFSAFYSWAKDKYYDGCELDKDLLVLGNKVYSPETCCFIDRCINNFIRITHAGHYDTHLGKYRAVCNNPFSGKRESLGLFSSKEEAEFAWRKRKHELSCEYARLQTNEVVANALRTRYA